MMTNWFSPVSPKNLPPQRATPGQPALYVDAWNYQNSNKCELNSTSKFFYFTDEYFFHATDSMNNSIMLDSMTNLVFKASLVWCHIWWWGGGDLFLKVPLPIKIFFFVHCLHQNKIELNIIIFAAKNCILMDKFYTF